MGKVYNPELDELADYLAEHPKRWTKNTLLNDPGKCKNKQMCLAGLIAWRIGGYKTDEIPNLEVDLDSGQFFNAEGEETRRGGKATAALQHIHRWMGWHEEKVYERIHDYPRAAFHFNDAEGTTIKDVIWLLRKAARWKGSK